MGEVIEIGKGYWFWDEDKNNATFGELEEIVHELNSNYPYRFGGCYAAKNVSSIHPANRFKVTESVLVSSLEPKIGNYYWFWDNGNEDLDETILFSVLQEVDYLDAYPYCVNEDIWYNNCSEKHPTGLFEVVKTIHLNEPTEEVVDARIGKFGYFYDSEVGQKSYSYSELVSIRKDYAKAPFESSLGLFYEYFSISAPKLLH